MKLKENHSGYALNCFNLRVLGFKVHGQIAKVFANIVVATSRVGNSKDSCSDRRNLLYVCIVALILEGFCDKLLVSLYIEIDLNDCSV